MLLDFQLSLVKPLNLILDQKVVYSMPLLTLSSERIRFEDSLSSPLSLVPAIVPVASAAGWLIHLVFPPNPDRNQGIGAAVFSER